MWREVGEADRKFTDHSRGVTLTGTIRVGEKEEAVTIACKESASEGEITGYITDRDTFTFFGCEMTKPVKEKCGVEGVIKTNTLDSLLIDHQTKGLSGLEPKEGETWVEFVSATKEGSLAEFQCGGLSIRLRGSISGVYQKVNKSATKAKLTLRAGMGEQDLVLESSRGEGYEAGKEPILTAQTSIVYTSKVEVKACNEVEAGPKAPKCEHAVPQGSCEGSSSLDVLVEGPNVVAYVPKGNWSVTSTTGVSVVNVEGSSVVNTLVPTADTVNSCAPNPLTGETVCTANDDEVYALKGTSLIKTLTSSGSGSIGFSGGSCTNCGVAMDGIDNKAVIGLSDGGSPGFQVLDLGSSTFEPIFASPAGAISESSLVDPLRHLLLSATETNDYEIVNLENSTKPQFYENTPIASGGELDSSAEDCSTGIALAPAEFSGPSNVFIADLTQAKFTPGSPGTWTAPSQVQTLSESELSAGPSGSAVAEGTHTGVITGEFGGNELTALALPTTSGSGTPKINDWMSCAIGDEFSNGYDPHTVTAYQSPSNGDAIALLANGGANKLARVDLTMMLNPSIVPRTPGGHACTSGTLPPSVESFLPVP